MNSITQTILDFCRFADSPYNISPCWNCNMSRHNCTHQTQVSDEIYDSLCLCRLVLSAIIVMVKRTVNGSWSRNLFKKKRYTDYYFVSWHVLSIFELQTKIKFKVILQKFSKNYFKWNNFFWVLLNHENNEAHANSQH